MILSIIVPIYGVEKYLEKCISSLVCTDCIDKYEVLLIDDGSKDGCGILCEKYSRLFPNIKTFHKENGGLSDARNYGIKKASGHYVMFVDGDDYVDEGSIARILEITRHSEEDVLCFGSHHINNGKINDATFTNVDESLDGISFFKYQYGKETMPVAVWNSIYKREFLVNNKLFFKKGILHEDNEWTPRVYIAAKKVKLCKDTIYYNYLIRENSICTKKDLSRNLYDIKQTLIELSTKYKCIDDKDMYRCIKDELVSAYLGIFGQCNLPEQKQFWISSSFILKDLCRRKTIFKALLYCFNKKIYCYGFTLKNSK